jgi:hypothetical protein
VDKLARVLLASFGILALVKRLRESSSKRIAEKFQLVPFIAAEITLLLLINLMIIMLESIRAPMSSLQTKVAQITFSTLHSRKTPTKLTFGQPV